MNRYQCDLVDKTGKKFKIYEKSLSRQMLEDELYQKGYYVVSIREVPEKTLDLFSKKLSRKFFTGFCYQIYSLLDFGVNINEVFSILKKSAVIPLEKEFIEELLDSLKKGDSVLQAASDSGHSYLFDPYIRSLIAAGEKSGKLDESFRLIHQYLTSNEKLKSKIQSAVIYPVFLIAAAFFVIHFLMLFVIPNFIKIYEVLDFSPPLIIAGVFGFSRFLTGYLYLYVLIWIILIIIVAVSIQTKKIREILLAGLEKLPVISKVMKYRRKIQISFSLMILLKGGITIEEALKKMESIMSDARVKEKIKNAVILLKNGNPVQKAIESMGIFDPKELSLITISESISKPIEGFVKIYKETEMELENYLERMMKLFEPVVMIGIGFIIFILMYMVISPTLGAINKME